MRNAVKFSVHAKFITSLDMILPILPYAISRYFAKNTYYKRTHSSHALVIHRNPEPYWNNCIRTFEAQFLSPLSSKWYNIKYALRGSLSSGSPSRGGDVTVYVWHKPPELVHSFLFCSFVYFSLRGPFNCISFNRFSRQLSVFSLCSSGLISALLVLLTIHLSMKVSFSPDRIPRDWLNSISDSLF